MSALISGKFIGVFNDHRGHFARFKPDNGSPEIEMQITPEQFQELRLNKETKLMIQVVV